MKFTVKNIRMLSLCLALLLLAGCGSTPTETTAPETTAPEASAPEAAAPEASAPEATASMETSAPETTAPAGATAPEATKPQETVPNIEDHLIPTPYGDLHFPGEWESFLLTETEEETAYTVTFFAVLDSREEPQKLFAVTVGGMAEGAIGALKGSDGKYAAVKAETFPFTPDDTWNDRDINIVFTMQEALNDVLESLPLEDAAVLTPPTEPTEPADKDTETNQPSASVNPDDMAMDTPYMELHYPSKWADYMTIKVDDGDPYGVAYGCVIGEHPEMHLFTVWFGGDKGANLKTIKAESGEMVDIRVEVSELELDGSWSEEERTIIFAMQEDLNYLLGKMN